MAGGLGDNHDPGRPAGERGSGREEEPREGPRVCVTQSPLHAEPGLWLPCRERGARCPVEVNGALL